MPASPFNYEFLDYIKEQSLALKLLRSPNFPLIGSFLYQAFLSKNRRSIAYQELVTLLDYHLADIAETYGADKYPKSAKAYIDDWVNVKGGYLRKFLPLQADEPECDLLPDVEKALRWLEDMQGKSFVGTESRLKMLLSMITDLVQGTTEDSEVKLASLEAQKAQLEQQIEAVKQGMDVSYSDTQIREKVYLLADMSRHLLGDFRQVEANFRVLDKDTRKKITAVGQHKGQVLDTVFSDQDLIDGSDEGKSFSAFFELLMRPDMRENMRDDLKALFKLPESRAVLQQDELLQHLYTYLLEAGAQVNTTKQQINQQLRRYVQEQSQDNKRILELIREFENKAHQLEAEPEGRFTSIDSFAANISKLFSRSLYQPKQQESLDTQAPEVDDAPDVDLSRLFDISRIDEQLLQRQIQTCLQQGQGQVTLADVVSHYPVEYGLDEILTYVKLACEQTQTANIDESSSEMISWISEAGNKQVKLPKITFVREL